MLQQGGSMGREGATRTQFSYTAYPNDLDDTGTYN